MNKLIIFITFLISATEALAKCTPEEINLEYSKFIDTRNEYLNQKKAELDTILEEIKIKHNLSDKEIFDYKITLLNDKSALKIKAREPDINMLDFFQFRADLKCGKMMKIHKKLVKYSDKQWAIIYSKARERLEKN